MWSNMAGATKAEDLTNIKWDGKSIFPIANEENRLLSEELVNRKREVQDLQTKIDEQSKLNSLLECHYNDIVKEIRSLKQVCQTRQKELDLGENVHKLLLREKSWLEKHTEILRKEIKSTVVRQEKCRASMNDQTRKKEKIQVDLHIDKETMEKWLKDSAKAEEDIEIIEKYKLMNDARIKEMEVKIEKANKESKHWKTLAKEVNLEVLSMQAELYRLAEDFKQAHQQRRDMINQIENGVETIYKKDNEITDSILLLDRTKKEISDLEEIIIEKKRFLDKSLQDDNNLENELRHLEQQLESIRSEMACFKKQVEDSNSELETQRLISSNLTSKLLRMRLEEKEKENQIEQKKTYLEYLDRENEKIDKDLQQLKKNELNDEKCLQQLEDNICKADIKFQKEQKNINDLLANKLKTIKELEEYTTKEKIFLNNIEKAKLEIRNINKKKSQEEAKIFQLREELYKLDYQILKLEQKTKQVEDDTSNQDELIELKAKVAKLNKIHFERLSTLKYLKIHIGNSRSEINRLKKKLQKTQSEQTVALNKLDEINLCLSSVQNEYKKAISEREELTVEECVLKVKLKRLQQLLDKKIDDVFSVQKENLQFETNIKQQLEELNVRKNVLKCEIRLSDQERQMLSSKLNKYNVRIETLQTRYKCILSILGLKNNEKKEVDLLIEAEQEKAKLKNDIYEETKAIEMMSEEVRGLKNNLKLIKAANEMYRQWLRPIEDRDSRRIHELEIQKKYLNTKLQERKEEINRLKDDLSSLRKQNEELENVFTDMQNNLAEKNFILEKTTRELLEQEEKLSRSDDINYRLCLSAKNSNSDAEQQIKDVKIRLLKEIVRQVINLVEELCESHPEVCERIRHLFSEASIPLPTKFLNKLSLRSLSRSSSLSKLSTRISRSQSKYNTRSSGSERIILPTNIISLNLDPKEV